MTDAPNILYYGDNLDILGRYVADESVDLVYLDPPFNSNATYSVLFAEHHGERAASQIKAFEDTWTWDLSAEWSYKNTVEAGAQVSKALQAFHTLLGPSNMLAYLAMMAPRLVELRRVLKPTGSIYLHCDPTSSHYLKLLMDSVFGPENFVNEIVWRRAFAHNDPKRCGRIHDTVLYYSSSSQRTWNRVFQAPSATYVEQFFDQFDPVRQERYNRLPLDAPRHGAGGNLVYEWKGAWPAPGRTWAYLKEQMEELDRQGRIHYPNKTGGKPRLKRYESEFEGTPLQDLWTDVNKIHNQSSEGLGYPTQKPEALLERIISASSNEGDVVLDSFCGCGTATVAAQTLGRRWIGIDITHLAITLIKTRLKDSFGLVAGKDYEVQGEPVSVPDAQTLAATDPWQFQWWALGLVGARPAEQKKGADKGIDGRLYFHDEAGAQTKQIILSV
jgi:DNA modification methylase